MVSEGGARHLLLSGGQPAALQRGGGLLMETGDRLGEGPAAGLAGETATTTDHRGFGQSVTEWRLFSTCWGGGEELL